MKDFVGYIFIFFCAGAIAAPGVNASIRFENETDFSAQLNIRTTITVPPKNFRFLGLIVGRDIIKQSISVEVNAQEIICGGAQANEAHKQVVFLKSDSAGEQSCIIIDEEGTHNTASY